MKTVVGKSNKVRNIEQCLAEMVRSATGSSASILMVRRRRAKRGMLNKIGRDAEVRRSEGSLLKKSRWTDLCRCDANAGMQQQGVKREAGKLRLETVRELGTEGLRRNDAGNPVETTALSGADQATLENSSDEKMNGSDATRTRTAADGRHDDSKTKELWHVQNEDADVDCRNAPGPHPSHVDGHHDVTRPHGWEGNSME